MDDIDVKLLNLIQEGIPLESRPFKAIGEKLGISEMDVIERINKLKDSGYIRRFGGIFNSKSLGYTGTLCAARVSEEKIDEVAGIINKYEEITHNYVREDYYNVWFTVVAPSRECVDRIINDIKRDTGIADIVSLPSKKLFKVKASFNIGGQQRC